MKKLVALSWILLFYFEIVMTFCGLETLHKAVRRQRVRPTSDLSALPDKQICRAIDYACVFYFKRVLCLQRSAATTILLRWYGRNSILVTGAQILPFNAHAWVQIGDRVVNDKPYILEMYQVLDRC